jgi:ferredoxin-nitrite reductase
MAAGEVQVTNRANLQVRSVQDEGLPEALATLQQIGLAAPFAAVDQLRNIMASPTAGIDIAALIDVCPIVKAVDDYLSNHPELVKLSAKFSIGLDGGEALSVRDRPNDVWLIAESSAHFRLFLAGVDTGLEVQVADAVAVVEAIAQVYLATIEQVIPTQPDVSRRRSHKPRLREVIGQFGMDWFLQQVGDRLPALTPSTVPAITHLGRSPSPIGIHPQATHAISPTHKNQSSTQGSTFRDELMDSITATTHKFFTPRFSNLLQNPKSKIQNPYYCGITLPLGRLTSPQLLGLANLAETYGNGQLRLTPWQNIILPNIPAANCEALTEQISHLQLSTSPNHPWSGLVACAGRTGCAASATNTQTDALKLAHQLLTLEVHRLDPSLNIHFSGCPRSCAQHHASDIAFLGIPAEDADPFQSSRDPSSDRYEVFIGSGEGMFGRSLHLILSAAQLPDFIALLLTYYQTHHPPQESFRTFLNYCPIPPLRSYIQEVMHLSQF